MEFTHILLQKGNFIAFTLFCCKLAFCRNFYAKFMLLKLLSYNVFFYKYHVWATTISLKWMQFVPVLLDSEREPTWVTSWWRLDRAGRTGIKRGERNGAVRENSISTILQSIHWLAGGEKHVQLQRWTNQRGGKKWLKPWWIFPVWFLDPPTPPS